MRNVSTLALFVVMTMTGAAPWAMAAAAQAAGTPVVQEERSNVRRRAEDLAGDAWVRIRRVKQA